MLGVDTNVLVRFITRDDDVQSPQTLALFRATENQPIYICWIAMVELVWVLTKIKKLPISSVLEICRDLLSSPAFKIERSQLVERAIDDAEQVQCDLADAMIALANAEAGCRATATFDIGAQALPGMTAVEALL